MAVRTAAFASPLSSMQICTNWISILELPMHVTIFQILPSYSLPRDFIDILLVVTLLFSFIRLNSLNDCIVSYEINVIDIMFPFANSLFEYTGAELCYPNLFEYEY